MDYSENIKNNFWNYFTSLTTLPSGITKKRLDFDGKKAVRL